MDPSGLKLSSGFCGAEYSYSQCGGDAGFWGGANGWFGGGFAEYDRLFGGMPASVVQQAAQYQLQREVDDFFRRLPPDAQYVGGLTWGYSRDSGDLLRSYSVSFSVSRGLDAYFNFFAGGFVIGRTLTDFAGRHHEYDLAAASAAAAREFGGGGADGSWDDDFVFRVYEPGKPAFQLKPGEEGISGFNPNLVSPPRTGAEVLGSFRPGSQVMAVPVGRISAQGLTLIRTPGAGILPVRLQQSHMEIRPGPGMTRNQFKKALRGLE